MFFLAIGAFHSRKEEKSMKKITQSVASYREDETKFVGGERENGLINSF